MKRTLFLLLLTAIIPMFAFFRPGLPVTHDGQDHVARIANFYASLSEGNIIPRWAANLNWGYGHPILMFLYPLPSYAASFIHFLGFSLVDSTKLVFVLSFIFSVLCMYFFVRDVSGEMPAIAASLLYGFAPYRFVDIYVRGAIGEHVAFIFPPLILWGLFGLAKKRKSPYWAGLVGLGTSGLILSHNAVSLVVLPFIGVYLFYLFLFTTKKSSRFLIISLMSIVFGFLLSAFFWIPAFFEGKYTLRDIVTQGEIGNRMVSFGTFFYSTWKYGGGAEFTKQLGMASWFIVAVSIFLFLRKKGRTKVILGLFISSLFLTLWLMTGTSQFIWEHVSLLQKFQFPWRLLTVTTLVVSLLSAFVLRNISRKLQSAFLIVIVLFIFLTTPGMWQPKGSKEYPETFFTGIYDSTTDTGESSPIWSVRFMEQRPNTHLGVISGQASIEEVKRTTTEHVYVVTASTPTRLVENTLYFPGWRVLIDSKEIIPQFQDPEYRGKMTFLVSEGKHTVNLVFTKTKLRTFSEILSLLALISIVPLYYLIGKRMV